MRKLAFDRAYQSVVSYAPEQVKEILLREIPRIEENIDLELEKFGAELSEFVDKETQTFVDSLTEQAKARAEKMRTLMKDLEDTEGSDELKENVASLKKQLDEYEAHWKGVGKGIQGVVKAGFKSAGLPV